MDEPIWAAIETYPDFKYNLISGEQIAEGHTFFDHALWGPHFFVMRTYIIFLFILEKTYNNISIEKAFLLAKSIVK